jgi:hypothetical protein
MINRFKAPAMAVAAVLTLTGCGLLDVDNPNNLVEDAVLLPDAASGVMNGSLRLVADGISGVWEAPEVVSDNLYWTGSRDAWGSLDEGFIGDPLNEFTDGRFPNLGQAVWNAGNAVTILEGHVADNPGDDDFALNLARAQMYNGIILMVTGEIQEDMTFSDRQAEAPPVGPAAMGGVLDDAVTNLSAAIAGFAALGEDELETTARALRARAYMSRVIWNDINPTASGTSGALAFPNAAADAAAVLADVSGDWKYNMTYSAATQASTLGANINNRGENQVDPSLVENDGPGASGRTGVITLLDPVTGDPDAAIGTAMTQLTDDQYGALTVTSERLMRLILAEDALAAADGPEFEAQINALRALDPGYTADYTYAAGTAVATLQHHRRVNTFLMGLRMQDMYRWGITDALWTPQSEAITNPGEMLPITIVECRANLNIGEANC